MDAYQRSTHGPWRPGNEVRPTSHRPNRFDAKICADLLGASDGGTCRLRTRTICQIEANIRERPLCECFRTFVIDLRCPAQEQPVGWRGLRSPDPTAAPCWSGCAMDRLPRRATDATYPLNRPRSHCTLHTLESIWCCCCYVSMSFTYPS